MGSSQIYDHSCCVLRERGALKQRLSCLGVISTSQVLAVETTTDIIIKLGCRRAKLKAAPPAIPMEIRVEKALDATYVCCFGKDPIEEEDETLLITMLSAVFPSVQQQEIQQMVREKALRVAEGGGDDYVLEAKPLSKEAVELQMKDLQFLRQNSET
ncbi:photosystem I assembly factor PSA3, chloroplastic [Arachis duranensis]|uniref:Photosystem I assembly factor PSA3, chloroplastic n=1 Tax=Arachis duranensis TaxID=130453 RepID=A0A9C6TYX8_ARADU|nr:photosystem I assembly factor PSA3, chloroplastic [Arachis duranensis]